MSFAELTGCIFIRSQAIEQLMRQLLENHSNYTVPANFERKTFGQLLTDFARQFPDIKIPKDTNYPDMTLYSTMKNARDIRNDAAHGYYLAGLAVAQVLDGYGRKADIDRFNLRSIQKSLMAVDICVFELLEFIQDNNLPVDLQSTN